jgi:hypothetical protein
MKKEFEENIHYYTEKGKIIFTEIYHLQRGSCCGNSCRHCPYEPKHTKGNTLTETDNFKDSKN